MTWKAKLSLIAVCLFSFMIISTTIYFMPEKITVKITGKERIGPVKDGTFFIYTDVDSFTNHDAWFFLKWNSGTVQAKAEVGKTYDVWVYGLRIGFFSMYKNIVGIEENEEFSKELCGTLNQESGEVLKGCFLFVGKKNDN